jgi:hypothetical protein
MKAASAGELVLADDPGNLPGAIRLFAWSLEPFSGGHEAGEFCEVAN